MRWRSTPACPPARAFLNGPQSFATALKPRANNSHKGSYGDVIVVGGARGMAGAPVLAARTAAFGGAGRVYVAFVDDGPAYDDKHPELMFRLADRVEFGASAALVVGPAWAPRAMRMTSWRARWTAKPISWSMPMP
jgi:NAD(P)H-hydrate repair Nnr-like enzyme with NAD(P)H-hydrate dehydratase domain